MQTSKALNGLGGDKLLANGGGNKGDLEEEGKRFEAFPKSKTK